MEQDRVVAQVGRSFYVTGELILKALYLASQKAAEVHERKHSHIHFQGQTAWQKFMATIHTKDVKDFLHNEVNLDALKAELERYQIGFAFHRHNDGSVSMAYDFKNKAIVEEAFSRVIQKITDQPQEVKEQLAKKATEKTLGEKIKHTETVMQELIKQTQKERAIALEQGQVLDVGKEKSL